MAKALDWKKPTAKEHIEHAQKFGGTSSEDPDYIVAIEVGFGDSYKKMIDKLRMLPGFKDFPYQPGLYSNPKFPFKGAEKTSI